MTDRQSFFALDFHELDRGLSQEERQAWNSIYVSFRDLRTEYHPGDELDCIVKGYDAFSGKLNRPCASK